MRDRACKYAQAQASLPLQTAEQMDPDLNAICNVYPVITGYPDSEILAKVPSRV
jgi:hypothetical protein